MTLTVAHSFLVHPAKHADEPPPIGGTRVSKKSARLFEMLEGVYKLAETECTIDISFDQAADGSQKNDVRELLVEYARRRQMNAARKIAEHLQSVTTNRSGLGLLFVMCGEETPHTKVVVSRFPADSGVLAEESAKGDLTVEFIERVFMKSATSYKSAVYLGRSFDADFWDGKVVDRQINNGSAAVSNYWIKDFLRSDFLTTSAAGTRRFADALRNASSSTVDVSVKTELAAAAVLVRGLGGRSVSAASLVEQLALSDKARGLVLTKISPEHLRAETFRFSVDEFERHVPFRSVELDSGALLTAKTDEFDNVFVRQPLREGDGGRVRFTAEGTVVNDRLRKRE